MRDTRTCKTHGEYRTVTGDDCPYCSANFWADEVRMLKENLILITEMVHEQIPDADALEKIRQKLKELGFI